MTRSLSVANLPAKLAGLVLIAAAALKGWSLVSAGPQGEGVLGTWAFQVALVLGEWVLGLWLLSEIRADLARPIGAGVFAMMAGAATGMAFAGASSCGCFGEVRVHPALTAAVDAGLAVLLARHRPPRTPATFAAALAWSVVALAVAAPGLAVFVAHRPIEVTTAADLPDSGRVLDLDPARWLGRAFPLASRIDIGGELLRGGWTVIVYRADCAACVRALEALHPRSLAGERIAAIEMPPFQPSPPGSSILAPTLRAGRLDTRHAYTARTPVVIRLSDGQVTAIDPTSAR